jgi:hypothetical protein
VRPDGAPACTLRHEAWFGDLSYSADGPVFATVLGASTSFALPQAGTGMFAQLADGGLRIAAWAHEPKLHLARPVALSKIVYPKTSASVEWVGLGRAGAVGVSLDVSSALADPLAARADVVCKDLSIAEVTYARPSSIPKAKARERILTGEAPLSATAGGPPVARVSAQPTAQLLIAGMKGASTHIVLDDRSFVIHGWIPSSSLEDGLAPGVGYGTASGYPAASITSPNSENQPCTRDLPVFVELAGTRAEIGVLAAGSPHPKIVTMVDATGYVEIQPYGRQWLQLAKGARLVMRESDRARCHD